MRCRQPAGHPVSGTSRFQHRGRDMSRKTPSMPIAIFAIALLAGGCSVDDGHDGAAGAPGTPGPPGPGVSGSATSLTFAVDSITIASAPVVDFTLTNED